MGFYINDIRSNKTSKPFKMLYLIRPINPLFMAVFDGIIRSTQECYIPAPTCVKIGNADIYQVP